MKIRNKKKIVGYVLAGGNILPDTHCTLWYQPYRSIKRNSNESDIDFERKKKQLEDKQNAFFNMIGKPFNFQELVILKDENVMTVVLNLEKPRLYNGPSRPHITIETYGEAKPVESNNLIKNHEELLDKYIQEQDGYKFTAYLSAMYYSREGKCYSTSIGEWK